MEALRGIAQEDSAVEVLIDPDSSEYILAGAGELQLEVVLNRLRDGTGVDVVVSPPMVSYRETVTTASSGPYDGGSCLAKSSNKHNRLYVSASPLSDDVIAAMEAGRLGAGTKAVERTRVLVSEFGWDPAVARKVMAVGPTDRATGANPEHPTCILVDCTHGVDNLHLIRGPHRGRVQRGVRGGAPRPGAAAWCPV